MILTKTERVFYKSLTPDSAPLSDAELAVRCREGDAQAFEVLYRKHSKGLFNFIYRMIGDYDRAMDLYHDVFIRVITAKKYEPRARFSTWIYKIATNLCINELKKNRPVSLDERIERGLRPRAGTMSPVDYAHNGELSLRMKRAIGELTETQRAVFTLRHYHGLSYQKIAYVLGCPVGTVKSRLNSAVNALRRSLRYEIEEVLGDEMQRD